MSNNATNDSGYQSKAQQNPKLSIAMFAPKYWCNWIAVFALRLLILLPYSWFMRIGRMLGLLSMLVIKRRVHITEQNFQLAMPHLSLEERKHLVREHFANVGMAVFETAMAWYWPDKKIRKLVQTNQEEINIAQKLVESKKGVIILTCHFVTLELMARMYGLYVCKGVGVYRPNDNPVLEYLQVKGRTRSNLYLIDRREVKPIIKALIKGLPIWYAPDQDYGRRVSIFVPFFAVKDAATVTGTAGFAKIKNTVVQPSYTIRLPNYKGYKFIVKEHLTNFPVGDDVIDATTCNKVIEQMINEAPEQYMWLHRRFKTQPDPNAPSRYHDI
jgi:Kdo2-lipid IVA lauroyltransferase/acyltransferase